MSQEKKERKLPKVLQGRHVSNKKLIYSIYFFLRLSAILSLVKVAVKVWLRQRRYTENNP